jgi:hypothetical protein
MVAKRHVKPRDSDNFQQSSPQHMFGTQIVSSLQSKSFR